MSHHCQILKNNFYCTELYSVFRKKENFTKISSAIPLTVKSRVDQQISVEVILLHFLSCSKGGGM